MNSPQGDPASQQSASGQSPESPWAVRTLNSKIKQWVERLGSVWVEGQITQLNSKPNWAMAYITLRDVSAEMSIQLTCPLKVLKAMPTPPSSGDRVLVLGRPQFYAGRGSLSLQVTEMRPVGIGELLARIAALRQMMAAEGLFAPELKRTPPLLPHRIGLITGRGSAAERDVLSVARDRWPDVDFRVINTAVQGARAVPEILHALATLEADSSVDVIIVARGGGSVEDLLPFSDETLVRAVAEMTTPVVSAIGHEPDHPLLDDVADVRAATPTDAAKRIVPDVQAELQGIADTRERGRVLIAQRIERERDLIADLRLRPVLANPMTTIDQQHELLTQALTQIRRTTVHNLERRESDIMALRARVSALGPAATLARGYSIVQALPPGEDPEVVTNISAAPPGTKLRIRVTDGSITAAAMQTHKAD